MGFLQRCLNRLPVLTILMLWFMISLVIVYSVQADVGVQPVLPAGSSILPERETVVQMAEEKVVFSVRTPTETDISRLDLDLRDYGMTSQEIPLVADVGARFWMLNPQVEPVDMLVWFPLAVTLKNVNYDNFGSPMPGSVAPSIREFQVFVENQPVETTITEFPNPNGEEFPLLPWASFPVSFAAGKETLIEVRYLLPAQSIPGNRVTAIFSYILQTGSGWAGPIGKAELVVNLPYPASQETIGQVTSGGELNDNQVSWTWTHFEPKAADDFSIELLRLEHWKTLNDLRAAVRANSEDGAAWMELSRLYQTLTTTKGQRIAPGIGVYYHMLAIEAFETTARLLPEESSVHASLAILYLPFPLEETSPQDYQRSLDELRIAEQLEARNPPAEGGISVEMVRDFFGDRLDAAATQIVNGMATPTTIPANTAPPKPIITSTQMPTATQMLTAEILTQVVTPAPTAMPLELKTSRSQDLLIALVASLVILAIMGYFVFKGQLRRLHK